MVVNLLPISETPTLVAMENLVCNLTGQVRDAKLYGRDYLVANATLIVPGVLHGSQGPLLYPIDEVANSAVSWDHIPIVVYHPKSGSAKNPAAVDKSKVGEVYNTVFQENKLRAELWFDAKRTEDIDSRIYDALINNRQIELSTGLRTRNEQAPLNSVYNAPTGPIPYTHIARSYEPDHLAVLPDQVGACSISDGCGVLNQDDDTVGSETNVDGHGGLSDTTFNREEPDMADKSKMSDEARKNLVGELINNSCCWEEADRAELDAMTDNQLSRVKQAADKQSESELLMEAAALGFNDGRDEITFNQERKIWEKHTIVPPIKEDTTVKNETTTVKAMTEEEWLSQAPASVQNTFAHAKEIADDEKRRLIDRITVNVSDDIKPEKVSFLSNKTIAELRQIASFMPKSEANPQRVDYYPGQPAGGVCNEDKIDPGQGLEPVDIDWVENSVFAKAGSDE